MKILIKKYLLLLLAVLISLSMAACKKEVVISYDETLSSGIDIYVGTQIDLMGYNITVNDGSSLSFSSLDSSVVTVSPIGIITGISVGESSIVISAGDSQISIPITVKESIYVLSSYSSITMKEGETYSLDIETNDELVYFSSNETIFVVDENGYIHAKSEGSASLKVSAKNDNTKFLQIEVNVLKQITLEVEETSLGLIVGDEINLHISSNDDVTYQSTDPNVVTVDEKGTVSAVSFGEAQIIVTSIYDETVSKAVDVLVYKTTETISIIGKDVVLVGTSENLSVDVQPVGAFYGVTWESLDESVAIVDENGAVAGVNKGVTTIVATSDLDENIKATFTVTVLDVLAVNSDASSGDVFSYLGAELKYGEKLFSSFTDLLAFANQDTIIIATGSFTEEILFNIDGINLFCENGALLNGDIEISADNITIDGCNFTNNAYIYNNVVINNFSFTNNHIYNLNDSIAYFLNIQNAQNVYLNKNVFENINQGAINVKNINFDLIINENSFTSVEKVIKVSTDEQLDITSKVHIWWNKIEDSNVIFDIDLSYGDSLYNEIEATVRFNEIINYVTPVMVTAPDKVDFTLNFWDGREPSGDLFSSINSFYLRGYYEDATLMKTPDNYQSDLPIYIIIDNPIDEIQIGETHQYQYSILPMELADHPIRFITGNPDLVAIDNDGGITPLSSGDAYIEIRSRMSSYIKAVDSFTVVTNPGIELRPSNVYAGYVVGDEFTLIAEPFPVSYENETVVFSSSNELVATIDNNGHVITVGPGTVTFTASFASDSTISQTFTINVYSALDVNNLLDYLTTKQISFSEVHEWTAYGFTYNYFDKKYESVSRYYFGDLTINDSKMLPVSYGIRPGEPMDPLPDGIPVYNNQNVYWVVVHDTANTSTGANALSHANYLYNAALAGTTLWTSWHFTIDDSEIYQHLPTYERGYHAGDGSTRPYEGSYLGGGNRNGIGIEMAINEDGDMMRTWQRTAKLVTQLLLEYNLPVDHQKFHNDFSGKDCPNTLRNAGLVPLFEEFVEVEYHVASLYPNAIITFESHNSEYLDNTGRIIQMPDEALTVSYTITINIDGVTESRTFYTYLPGTIH